MSRLPTQRFTFLSASCHRCLGLVTAALLVLASVVHAAPENLGLGLKELVASHERALQEAQRDTLSDEQLAAVTRRFGSGQFDDQHRVLVDVYLDGTVPLRRIIKIVNKKLGGDVTGSIDWYRSGTLSAYLPVRQVAKFAKRAGISSVALTPVPTFHVGKTTSQGYVALNANTVNATYQGTGITVGVLSDSFDTKRLGSTQPTTTASQDVTNGDLPGTGNPDGYTTPVNVLQDYGSASAPGTDEGRAMCQIVHDLAPASALAFATGQGGVSNFATNIIALATATGSSYNGVAGAGCKVVCDDLTYSNEPMFSDGVVAQAVDRVTGLGATYFSSAGNDGNSGYIGTFTPQANNSTTQGLLLSEGGITYSSIPSSETGVISQFHSFGTSGGNPVLVQKVLIPAGGSSGGTLNFQWDDPSDVITNNQESVTTDYDLLVFSVSGTTATYQSSLSLTANNFATNEPIEYNGAALAAGTQYEFVLVKTNRTPTNTAITANLATHLRWVLDTDSQQIIGDYVFANSPNSYGHTSASTCNSTAAYQYDKSLNTGATSYTPVIEAYSSNGPVDIYFNSAGTRLAAPESRKQPTLAAVDGVDTSFFGSDSDGDGFPNFFGTSAAAPHAAACAALLLNAASVLNKPVTPADVRDFLVNTTQGSSDQDPGISSATLTLSGVAASTTSVTFTALDHSLLTDPYSLNVAFTGTTGQALTSLTITLPSASGSGVAFITSTYPFTAGPATGGATFTTTPASPANFTNPVTLNFTSFTPGNTLAFGVARYVQVGTSSNYRSTTKTDLLAGTTLSATITGGANPGTYTGTLANAVSRKWNYKSGYGLIDINAAVNALTNGN